MKYDELFENDEIPHYTFVHCWYLPFFKLLETSSVLNCWWMWRQWIAVERKKRKLRPLAFAEKACKDGPSWIVPKLWNRQISRQREKRAHHELAYALSSMFLSSHIRFHLEFGQFSLFVSACNGFLSIEYSTGVCLKDYIIQMGSLLCWWGNTVQHRPNWKTMFLFSVFVEQITTIDCPMKQVLFCFHDF